MTEQDPQPVSVFTVGHSNLSLEAFQQMLAQHEIQAVADVRSTPYSEYTPQFNRETLQKALDMQGIEYFFMGDALGARREEASCYREDGVADYALIAEASLFKAGLERAEQRARAMRLALMCSEKDPLQCHRFLLISRQLKKRGLSIFHILEAGTVESQSETENRLLRELNLMELDLFRSEAEVLDEAYDRQGAKSAYRRKPADD